MKRKHKTDGHHDATAATDGIAVPVVAGFPSYKCIPPPFTLGRNNVNPKLILYENELEYRAFLFTRRKKYSDIEHVDVRMNFGSLKNVSIYFKNSQSAPTFAINEKHAKELLRFLKKEGANLSERAEVIISE